MASQQSLAIEHFSAVDDELLIKAVKKNQPIYNRHHKLFKDFRGKDKIWRQISEIVNKPVSDCKRRWKSIKDTYDRKIRIKASKTDSEAEAEPWKKKKKWHLEEKLSFLQSGKSQQIIISDVRNMDTEDVSDDLTVDPLITEIEIVEESEPNNEENVLDTCVHTAPLSKFKSSKRNPKVLYEGDRDKFSNITDKRKKNWSQILQQRMFEEEDDDVDLFFKSIAKSVKLLHPELRARAKIQSLTLVAKLESEMHSSHWVTD